MKLIAFTALRNAISRGCPVLETAISVLPKVDEYLIVEGFGADDETWPLLQKMKAANPKIRLDRSPWKTGDFMTGSSIGAAFRNALGKIDKEQYVMKVEGDEYWSPEATAAASNVAKNEELFGASFIYHTLDTWDRERTTEGWYGWRWMVAEHHPRLRIFRDGYSFLFDEPLPMKGTCFAKIPAHVYNLGYVFPENIWHKFKQNKVWHGNDPTFSFRDSVEENTRPEDFVYTPDEARNRTRPFNKKKFPDYVKSLFGKRKYEAREDLLDLIRDAK